MAPGVWRVSFARRRQAAEEVPEDIDMSHSRTVQLLIASVMFAQPVRAQQAQGSSRLATTAVELDRVHKGSRVRVWSAATGLSNRNAQVLRVTRDTLLLDICTQESCGMSLALAHVDSMRLRTKQGWSAGRDALVGVLVGGVGLAGLAYLTCNPDDFFGCGFSAGVGGLLGVLAGAIAGSIVGNVHGQRWLRVNLRP
jgi:hypothetical protein